MRRIQELHIFLALTLLVVVDTASLPSRSCSQHEECGPQKCCSGYLLEKGRGICVSRMAVGQRCRPLILPGLEDCPCEIGLTCALSTRENQKSKFYCKKIKTLAVEHSDDGNFIKHV